MQETARKREGKKNESEGQLVREVFCVDSYVHVKGLAKSKKFEKHTEDRKNLGGTLEKISR